MLDIDIAGDLALLKKNLAKFKKGKHGKGLQDILIQELDLVSTIFIYFSSQIQIIIHTYHNRQVENNRKVKAVTIMIYETSL